jgi:hypothetical protein
MEVSSQARLRQTKYFDYTTGSPHNSFSHHYWLSHPRIVKEFLNKPFHDVALFN